MSDGTPKLIKFDGEDGISSGGMLLVKRTAETLHKHYPGHLWAVNIDEEGGVITVMNLALSGKWGFLLKLKTVQEDPDLKSVMRAGGELLERYRLRRGGYRPGELSTLQRNFRGDAIADT
jgi:hypothetical protein